MLFFLRLRLTPLRIRPRPYGIDVVVHVDPDGPGHDLCNACINPVVRRIQPYRPEQHAPPAPTAVVRNSRRERLERVFFIIPIVPNHPGKPIAQYDIADLVALQGALA